MNQAWIRFLPSFIRNKLNGRHSLQQVLSNTGWLLADRLVRMGVGLLVGVWVARYLEPQQFGLLNYAIAFVSLFSAIAGLGLDGIVIREIVKSPEHTGELLGTTFTLKITGGFVSWLLTIGGAILLRPQDTLMHWLIGIIAAGTIVQALDTIDFWFQAQVQSKYSVYAKNIAFICISIVKVWLIQKHAPLIAFAWAGLAETIIGAIGLAIVYRIQGHQVLSWRFHSGIAKRLLQDSYPLIFSSIIIIIYMRVDQIMLAQMIGEQEVGIYSSAVRLAEVWYFIPGAIVSSTFPSIVEVKKISESLFYEKLQSLYKVIALLSYAVAIPVTFLSGWVIELLFGSAYARAAPMLSILIWSGLFVGLGVARSTFLTVMNWNKLHLMTVGFGCMINVVLNLFLIPLYGGVGAAIATCIAYWVATHGACFMHKHLLKTGHMLTKAMFSPINL